MPFLHKAENVIINGGLFLDNSVIRDGPSGIDTLLKASSPDAAYDSAMRNDPPRCFPGTREQYITDIVQWVSSGLDNAPLPIFWMKGPAGVGKSAIAQTCAERLKSELHKPSAAFFFSVNGPNDPKRFFTSIAYQLSTAYPQFRALLDERIRSDRTVVEKTLPSQLRHLILQPLRELERGGVGYKRIPVIVDVLDECEGSNSQCEILRTIASSYGEDPDLLCWVIFSRPEPYLEATFSEAQLSSLCSKVFLPVSQEANEEIALYLRDGFKNILLRRNIRRASPWPSPHDIEFIVHAADGLFILAASILRYIDQPQFLDPDETLKAVITAISGQNHAFPSNGNLQIPAALDALYLVILRRLPVEHLRSIQLFLSASSKLRAICGYLSAVMHVQEQPDTLRLDFPNINPNQSHFRLPSDVLDDLRGIRWRELDDTYPLTSSVASSSAPTSASLSFPYSSELVNSIIKAEVYDRVYYTSTVLVDSHEFEPKLRRKLAQCDFRKSLQIRSSLLPERRLVHTQYRGCSGYLIHIGGAVLCRILPTAFADFDVDEFRKMLERRRGGGIIRPYPRSLSARVGSFFHKEKCQDPLESGLLIMGKGQKAIYWYWEIDHRRKYFQSFQSADLAAGERALKEDNINEWLKNWDDRPKKKQ
ncbi:hypothetical protein AN958_08069 [Leucoagaricus sp. SymC.cos]|nr:hypothetical protein AN958_08069 [Leucoagaricus sp. SymC.cos]